MVAEEEAQAQLDKEAQAAADARVYILDVYVSQISNCTVTATFCSSLYVIHSPHNTSVQAFAKAKKRALAMGLEGAEANTEATRLHFA